MQDIFWGVFLALLMKGVVEESYYAIRQFYWRKKNNDKSVFRQFLEDLEADDD